MFLRIYHRLGQWRYILFATLLIILLTDVHFSEKWKNRTIDRLIRQLKNSQFIQMKTRAVGTDRGVKSLVTVRRDPSRFEQDIQKQYKTCNPVHNIMFLKVHKCASSTISSLFLRFAMKYDLNVALPPHDFGHIGWPKPLEKQHVFLQKEIEKANLDINLIAHHITYNKETIRSLMPEGTRLFAILRPPYPQLRSSLNFFRVAANLGLTDFDAMSEFLNNADQFESRMRFVFNGTDYGERSITKNFMSTEFGLMDEHMEGKTEIATFINGIENDFHLVMIKEYLYESVVLLRRILCWDLGDLMFKFLNRRHYRIEFNEDFSLVQKHKAWSPVDYALYEHFNKTLWERIAKEDSSFWTEVELLQNINERANRLCHNGQEGSFIHFQDSRWNKAFSFKKIDCQDLNRMPEYWTEHLKNRLIEKLKTATSNTSRTV